MESMIQADLPHNYTANTIAYVGTHDNPTKYQLREGHVELQLLWSDSCIHTMQDLLGLDDSARMNIPATVGGNWCWRMKQGATTRHTEDFKNYH